MKIKTLNIINDTLKISLILGILICIALIMFNITIKTVKADTIKNAQNNKIESKEINNKSKHKVSEQVLFCEKVEKQENGFYTLNLINPITGEGYIIGDYYAENKEQIDQCYYIAIIDTLNDDILENNEILDIYAIDEYGLNNDNIDISIKEILINP